jgi:hypothetical protein
MANIAIDGHTVTDNPNSMTIVRAEKRASHVLTYSNVGFFNWGVSIIGKEIALAWNWMAASEFDTLAASYVKDGPVVFDPQDDSSKTYNVQIVTLEGAYHVTIGTGSVLRKDVKMTLLIMSQV